MDSRKSQAQEMIEKYNLEPLLSEMLNSLVYRKIRNPELFMIKYLANHLSAEEKSKFGIHVPESQIQSVPIVKKPKLENEILKNHVSFDENWNKLKYNKSNFGATIMDVVFRDGIHIPDGNVII